MLIGLSELEVLRQTYSCRGKFTLTILSPAPVTPQTNHKSLPRERVCPKSVILFSWGTSSFQAPTGDFFYDTAFGCALNSDQMKKCWFSNP